MDVPDYLWKGTLPDGRILCIMPLLHGQARLGVGPPDCPSFDNVW